MIVLILIIALLSVITSVEYIRIRKLESHMSQLNLDVEMLIQNSHTLDK